MPTLTPELATPVHLLKSLVWTLRLSTARIVETLRTSLSSVNPS